MTKGIDAMSMKKHLVKMGYVQASGRNKLAPELTNDNK